MFEKNGLFFNNKTTKEMQMSLSDRSFAEFKSSSRALLEPKPTPNSLKSTTIGTTLSPFPASTSVSPFTSQFSPPAYRKPIGFSEIQENFSQRKSHALQQGVSMPEAIVCSSLGTATEKLSKSFLLGSLQSTETRSRSLQNFHEAPPLNQSLNALAAGGDSAIAASKYLGNTTQGFCHAAHRVVSGQRNNPGRALKALTPPAATPNNNAEQPAPIETQTKPTTVKVTLSRDGRYLDPAKQVCTLLGTRETLNTVNIDVFDRGRGLYSVATHGENSKYMQGLLDQGLFVSKLTCRIPAEAMAELQSKGQIEVPQEGTGKQLDIPVFRKW
jgi:hypothetical protein